MSERLNRWIVPAYLLLCLFLGGSAQGIWSNLALQLIAVAILAWALIAPRREPLAKAARPLRLLVIFALLLGLVQLMPLPPGLWPTLPGREVIASGYRLLAMDLPWLPLSLAPYTTAATLLALLPPMAILAAMLRQGAYRRLTLAAVLFVGTIAGVVLGTLQVTGDEGWYLYPFVNLGKATGFFANSNHMATLLVVTIPFLAAMVAAAGGSNQLQRYSAALVFAGAGMVVILIGLVLNGSLAGLGLVVPVLIASLVIVSRSRGMLAKATLVGAVVLVVAGVGLIFSDPLPGSERNSASVSVQSRRTMLSQSLAVIADFAPLGSGLGTFPRVYAQREDPAAVDSTYVNHAHDDFVELVVEAGVPALLLLLAFVAWWTVTAAAVWRSAAADPYAKAATVASAAILAHSLVDYPLRTAALTAVFAMCLVLMTQPRAAPAPRRASSLWPSRHLEVR